MRPWIKKSGRRFLCCLRRLAADENGANLAEYALLTSLIGAALVSALSYLGGAVQRLLESGTSAFGTGG